MAKQSKLQIKLVKLSESRHFDRDLKALDTWGFETFMNDGSVTNDASHNLSATFPEYQLLVYDTSKGYDDLIGFCKTTPVHWNGVPANAPLGYDDTIERHIKDCQRSFNTLSGRAITVREDLRGCGLSHFILNAVKQFASNHSHIEHLLMPVRPTLKSKYPFVPIEEYIKWKTPDGRVFDPWLRVHLSAGGRILGIAHQSMLIHGTVAQWKSWAGDQHSFDKDGEYVVRGALVPIQIDLSRNKGTYIEPNICISHSLVRSVASPWWRFARKLLLRR